MSLPADQLSKVTKVTLPGEAPPDLKSIVCSFLMRCAAKKKLVLISAGCILLLLCSRDITASEKIMTGTSLLPAVDSSGSDLYLYRARGQELGGNYAAALKNYQRALETDKNSFSIVNNIAYLFLLLGLPDESISYSQQALALNGEYVPALVNMGIATAESGNTAAAQDYLEKAITLDPGNETALLNLAVLHERSGNFHESSRFYEKLLLLGSSAGHMGLARSYEKQGKFNEALKIYKRIQASALIDEKSRSSARQRIMILTNDARR